MQWRFWAGRRDRLALALVGVFTLAVGLAAMSTLADSVRGTVAKAYEQTWRAPYDILVHVPLPDGATLPDLQEPNVLSTLPQGITVAQWESIKQMPGVSVAAPIAAVGYLTAGPSYLIPSAEIPLTANGLYQTHETIRSADPGVPQVMEQRWRFARAVGTEPDPAWPALYAVIDNSRGNSEYVISNQPVPGVPQLTVAPTIPVFLAGIDPEAESTLVGLDRSVTDGQYLSAGSVNWDSIHMGLGPKGTVQQWPVVPVMINMEAFRAVDYTFAVEELNTDQTVRRTVFEKRWTPAELAKAIGLGEKGPDGDVQAMHRLMGKGGPLRFRPVTSPFPDRWPTAVAVEPRTADLSNLFPPVPFAQSSVDLGPTYREWQPAKGQITADNRRQNMTLGYHVVGYFDSANLAVAKDPKSHMPLMTYRPAEAEQVLDRNGKPLNPPQSIAGGISPVSFLTAPPALLTNIEGAVAIAGDGVINAIQVKVAGTDHFTPDSVARVQAIARAIEQATGLVAEVTMGSSPAGVLVQASPSAGQSGFGWLEETWIHKHAGVTAVQQTEFGYSAFLLIMIIVGSLYALATALAGVTARRRELGVAVAIGWPRGAIARVVMGEQVLFGLMTGLLAAVAAVQQSIPLQKVGVLFGLGVVIYLPAMSAAAYLAVRTAPGEALKWGDTAPARRVLPGAGVLSLALSSLVGRPLRSLLTIIAMALPSALLLVLTTISRHLHGVLYTTLTGQYAALKAGPFQYGMSLVALLIAAVAAYDLVRQNAADHRREHALLSALGWPRRSIAMTVILEGAAAGLAAGAVGSVLGFGLLSGLYGRAVLNSWQALLISIALPAGLGLLAGAMSALAELRVQAGTGLAGAGERQVARFGSGTWAVGAVLLLLLVGSLLRVLGPQIRQPALTVSAPAAAQSVQAGAVSVRYPAGLDQVMVQAIASRAGQAAATLPSWLGSPASPVVELEDRRTALHVEYGEPISVGAPEATLPVLFHGLVRSQIMARSHNQAAGWLQDGVAHFALDQAGYGNPHGAVDLLRPFGPVPLDRLASLPPGDAGNPEYERAVATTRLLMAYLAEGKGTGVIGDLLDDLAKLPVDERELGSATYNGRNQATLAALAAASGKGLLELEQGFATWFGSEAAAIDQTVRPVDPTPAMTSHSRAAPAVRTEYTLDVKLDPANMRLTASQQVRFTNNEEQPLDSLYFHLFPNAPHFAHATRPGAMTVTDLQADGRPVPLSSGKREILGLQLPTPLQPGKSVTLTLQWTATVPDMKGRYGTDGSTIYLGNFYPLLAVHDAGGHHLDRYVPAGDPFYSEVADYDVTFTVPSGYMVAATGHSDRVGHFTAQNVRDFAAAASPHWQLSERTVDGVQVHSYYNAQIHGDLTADEALATAVNALQFFNQHWGPYPYSDLTIVNGMAMEYPQFIMAEATPAVIIHELAHQWWYGAVGNDENRQVWDEGLTEFATLYYLASTGEGASRFIELGAGPLDDATYRFPQYNLTAYGRGWRLWEALRTSMGDRRFERMVQSFYKAHQFGVATWSDWRQAVLDTGDPKALEIFDAYVYQTGRPADLPDSVRAQE